MRSTSSVVRWYLVAGMAGLGVIAACANSADTGPYSGGCVATGCSDAAEGQGGDSSMGSGSDSGSGSGSSSGSASGSGSGSSSGSTNDTDSGNDSDGASGSGSGSSSGSASGSGSGSSSGGQDAGAWIDMTTNPNGCNNNPGAPCGWTATPGTAGYVCTCYNGMDAVPWGCESHNSCVTPGPACPASNAPICDGGTSSGSDSGADGGVWIYMGNNANACDGNLGDPCGWTITNGGQGYTCQTTSFGTGCEPG